MIGKRQTPKALLAVGLVFVLSSVGTSLLGQPNDQDLRSVENLQCSDGVPCVLRRLAEMTEEQLIALAKYGEPTSHKVELEAERSLDQLLEKICPGQPDAVVSFLNEELNRLNFGSKNGLGSVNVGEVVAVPFCLPLERNVKAIVQAGDTPGTILNELYGPSDSEAVTEFYRANRDKYVNRFVFVNELVIGHELTVPYKAERRVYVRRNSEAPTANEIFKTPGGRRDLVQRRVERNVLVAEQSDIERGYSQLNFVSKVDLTSLGSYRACSHASLGPAKYVNAEYLKHRLKTEIAIYTRWGDYPLPDKVVIGVIDSGLGKVGDDFFAEAFFKANRRETIPGRDGLDNDNNKYFDDFYGINVADPRRSIEPIRSSPKRAHGTEMASLVLGGIEIVNSWPKDPELEYPLELRIVNFAAQTSLYRAGVAPPSQLYNAIEHLRGQGARVVNMSLATEVGLRSFAEHISGSSDNVLYVVSAGNEDVGEGRSLAAVELYPARFGGPRGGHPNVVTVGAHDLEYNRAKFSHHSRHYVDIFAPGCAVEARDDEGRISYIHGTSPAAAITSFTAGLINHLLDERDPVETKTRLLIGTDYSSALKDEAYSSGTLNIIKAISVYTDIIELTGSQDLRFGRIVEPENFLAACSVPPDLGGNSVRKIIPNIRSNGTAGRKMEIWYQAGDDLIQETCDQMVSEDANVIFFSEDGIHRTLELSEIKEIILSGFDWHLTNANRSSRIMLR